MASHGSMTNSRHTGTSRWWCMVICVSLCLISYRVGLRTILRLFLLCIVWLRLSTIMIKRKWWWWWSRMCLDTAAYILTLAQICRKIWGSRSVGTVSSGESTASGCHPRVIFLNNPGSWQPEGASKNQSYIPFLTLVFHPRMMRNLQSYPTTVLNERIWHFGRSKHTLTHPTYLTPNPQDLYAPAH